MTLIARPVSIKRVDRFLRLANSLRDLTDIWFLMVCDGEPRNSTGRSADAHALADQLMWVGFRRDMPSVYFASDLGVRRSDNEDTPVRLIWPQAATGPVVSTLAGGTATVVGDARLLTPADDEHQLAASVRMLLNDHDLAVSAGGFRRKRVIERFTFERLIADVDPMYHEHVRR